MADNNDDDILAKEERAAVDLKVTAPGRLSTEHIRWDATGRHRGVLMTGSDGADGPKAFYIHIEAKPDRIEQVESMLADILSCVEREPATGPWFGVRYSDTVFAIFEAFPDIAGRNAHVAGGGGEIFRDLERMNDHLVQPAHVAKLDILMSKRTFA
ncbi:putative quinol monooxygenase [Allobranchiibius sp. CTAmp26]|uniref:putative quinol monooxygenase n=1 Tax=Allobranchiibius sp. CTAmp26 TaxID=2815214 RepID=UPI001AA0C568|nr:hypothetical protein [Allobranchiibius sp. CTAmp26]MBO1756731.1 hypothetical protein [Allobranchiibius sp. CTAmp26]